MSLQAPWLVISNGLQHYCCFIDKKKSEYSFLKEIPDYAELNA
jgi:hypothetical protein